MNYINGRTGIMEMETYKTSVLMSVYQKEKAEYLDLALESILCHQSVMPDEFILICDGPLTPELDLIIEKYKLRYAELFKVYKTESNQGLGKALSYGVSKCSYDIIVRADSDDICESYRIEEQLRYLKEHPEVAIVSSYIDEFDEDWYRPKSIKKLPLTSDELFEMAKFRNPINHMAVAFRKKAILAIGSYHHFPYIEDYELWVRAIVNGYKIGNIDKVLVHARVGNGMVKRRGNKQYIISWRKLNDYMFDAKMINRMEYIRNMIAVRVFVYMPVWLKKCAYKNILRK